MIERIIDVDIDPKGVRLDVAFEYELGEIKATVLVDIVSVLEKLAAKTDNKIDDALVEMVNKALYPECSQ